MSVNVVEVKGLHTAIGGVKEGKLEKVSKSNPYKDYNGKYKNTKTVQHLQAQASLFPASPMHGYLSVIA